MSDLQKDIEIAINCASRENESGTPDFILAEYLMGCLRLYEKAIKNKEAWNNPYLNKVSAKSEIKEIITDEQVDLFAKFKKEKPEILHTDTEVCFGDKNTFKLIKILRRMCKW